MPGNHNPENMETTEEDTGIAQRVIIMPPLGVAHSSTSEELIVNNEKCIINNRNKFQKYIFKL